MATNARAALAALSGEAESPPRVKEQLLKKAKAKAPANLDMKVTATVKTVTLTDHTHASQASLCTRKDAAI